MTKFFAMAIAALAIVSCSKEQGGSDNGGSGGTELNTPTYATFKFNIGTRAVADFDPTTTPAADAADAKIGKLQLLIFNSATQALEFNGDMEADQSKTVLLTAGKKKIFVIANSDKLDLYNTAIDPATFKPGEATSTLSKFNEMNFSAGVPQQITVDQTGDRTFNFSKLYTLSNTTAGAEAGLPMSNTNEITYTLKAGVTEADAKAGTAEAAGVSETNTFKIQLYYMVAKARLVLATDVPSTGDLATKKPVIKDVMYSVRNLARVTKYVQNVPTANSPQSFYYTFKGDTKTAFDAEFDYASNITVPAPISTTPGDYLYVPENNNMMMFRGQASHFAIKATYEPVVISKVEYDLNNKVKYTYSTLATADAATKSYIYTTNDVNGIPAGSYFLTLAMLEEAAWMMDKGVPFVENTTNREEAKTMVADPTGTKPTVGGDYMSFTDGLSYYRVDLGEGTGAETAYGVLRSNKYDATVNSITGPGVPSEEDLAVEPGNPVSAKTYIHATILPAVWNPIAQTADL